MVFPLDDRQGSPQGMKKCNNHAKYPQSQGKGTNGNDGIHREKVKCGTQPLIDGRGRDTSIVNTNFGNTIKNRMDEIPNSRNRSIYYHLRLPPLLLNVKPSP